MKHHFFLLAALVIYQKDKLERTRHFNILMSSEERVITREQIGRAQQQAQVRFFTEFDKEHKAEVVDVFIQSVSHLGHMTDDEFHKGFDHPGQTEPEGEAVQDLTQTVQEPANDAGPEYTLDASVPVADLSKEPAKDEDKPA